MASTVTILAYHRVETPDNQDLAPTVIDAYPVDFEAQMRYVASRYNVISAWDLVRALKQGASLPRRALMITFDDGYRSFKENAMPILRRFDLPASVFLVTHYVGATGAPFWWDTLYRSLMHPCLREIEVPRLGTLPLHTREQRFAAYNNLVDLMERMPWEQTERLLNSTVQRCGIAPAHGRNLLDWDEVEELANEGVAIGSHTRHHPVLSRMPTERVRNEIAGSWDDLKTHLSRPLPIFCYPTGKPHAVNMTAERIARKSGFVGACTMIAGLNKIGQTDPFHLYRIGMEAGEPLPRFALKISPAGRAYRSLKTLLRASNHRSPQLSTTRRARQ